MCDSTETGGSATELSATDAWHGAAVGDEAYVRPIGKVARLNFRQKARNLHSTEEVNSQKKGQLANESSSSWSKQQSVVWMGCVRGRIGVKIGHKTDAQTT